MDPSHRESAQLCSGSTHGRSPSACPAPPTPKSRRGGLIVFLAAISFLYFAKALTGSYLKSSITQIERRFELPSSLVGVIDGSFEIGNLLVITVVSYFGGKLHRPQMIGGGALLMAAGTFLIALPHFIMGRYIYDRAVAKMANSSASYSPCPPEGASQRDSSMDKSFVSPGCQRDFETSLWIYILLGNLLRGVGEAPIQPLGISYIDDHAAEDSAAFYIGCVQTAAVIGPIFGFLLGSLCASLFVDVGAVDLGRVTITPRDAQWVGAWWLGYLVAGGISVLAALPFWCLPQEQPRGDLRRTSGTPSEQSKFILEDLRDQKDPRDPVRLLTMARGFLPSLRQLLWSPLFLLFLCGSVFQYNSLVGLVTYKGKYMEQQYGQTAARTNLVIGLINVPAVALGIFSGGVVMKKLRVGLVGAAKLLLSSSLIGYVLLMSLFVLGCERPPVAGLTVTYAGSAHISAEDGALAGCNVRCRCPQDRWEPVCGDNGVTYPSACLAGCHWGNGTGKSAVYYNCSCVTPPRSPGSSASPGPCPRPPSCSRRFLYFVVISVLSSFTLSFGGTPGYILLLRCVRPELKSLALGIYTLTVRVLAGVPAPMYFGALIDSACLQRGGRRCSGRGSCRLYNTDAFRFIYLGMALALGVVFLGLCAAVLYILKKRTGCTGCKSSALPSTLVSNVHLLQTRYWPQKETRL